MRLTAIDLEGTGSQDGDEEAILEIALVPLDGDLAPDMTDSFESLVNPQRPIPKRPWISPGLTDEAVQDAPLLYQIEPNLKSHIDGAYLVGHNVRVDHRLVTRRCPALRPAGMLDTLKLAKAHHGGRGNGLGKLVERYDLADKITELVPDGRPHRALWDTVACALLLGELKTAMGLTTLDQLVNAAAIALPEAEPASSPEPPTLFGLATDPSQR